MNRSTWLRLGAIGTVLLMPMATAAAAPPAGSPGIGDPYYPDYGNGGYDVAHYALNVEYNEPKDTVSGVATITATSTQDLKQFNLDLALRAKLVTVNGRPAKFTQSEHELVVTPTTEIAKGQGMQIKVTYAGNPSTTKVNGFTPWIKTKDGAAALGEPEAAAWWFPSNDHPRDKATYDINVTVPKGVEALSNGILKSSKVNGDWQTWRWSENKPMATYLAFFVTGQFDIQQGTANGRPWLNASASGKSPAIAHAKADLARTPEVIAWEEQNFGPYPFEAMGGVAPDAEIGFALETQTRPVYSNLFWQGGSNMSVVVHENAHQWFGDSVSLHNWRDIWLNEGFASYAEWLWSEKQGEGTRQDLFDSYYLTPPDDAFWTVKIGDPGSGNEFNRAVYNRGAMTVAALRNKVGEANMAKIIQAWTAEKKYGNAQIADFVAVAERISGQKLDDFFKVWLYTGQRPAPTVANGFPADFAKRAKVAAPKSRAMLDANHEKMIQVEKAHAAKH